MGRVFDELKRRNVFRVAVAYVIASWLVLQVADIVLQGIEAPAWVMKVFMLVLALGLPFVLMFSWAYELTPEGIKKEADVDRTQSITPETGRKLNLITIGMLVAVVVLVGIDRAYMHGAHAPAATATGSTAAGDKSIAVLAFEDLSPEGDQAYFADGLSEELLNVLAKVGDLKVAGRTSSFAFKGTNKDLREIGELLNVAHILEGSVRKAGNRIRVTAQLIKADDGFHLFSETYDRELDDIFAVQDEIAQKISQTLLTEIVGTEIEATAQTDPQAYEYYLMARQRIHTRDTLLLREAAALLDRALDIDPLYAPALAQKALTIWLLSDSPGSYGDAPAAIAMPEAMRLVDQALAVDENLVEGLAIKGLLFDNMNRVDEAMPLLERTVKLNPAMSDPANWLALALFSKGEYAACRVLLEGIVERDPTYSPAVVNLVFDYVRTAEFDRVEGLIDRSARILGESVNVIEARGYFAILSGRTADGVRLFDRALGGATAAPAIRLWYAWALMSIGEFEKAAEMGVPPQKLYALEVIGDTETAAAMSKMLDIGKDYATPIVTWVTAYHLQSGTLKALTDRVRDQIGGLERLLELYSNDMIWGSSYLGPLAYAYLKTGDEQSFRRVHGVMRDVLEMHAEQGADNWFQHYSLAEYAALAGDAEGAADALKAALKHGVMLANHLESPLFDGVREAPGFAELEVAVQQHIDTERAKLGLPPYRPLDATSERRTFVN